MSRFLLFRLFGPFAAWGDIAVGERRHVFSQPSKSGVLGLVGGALGLDRADESSLAALHAGYGFASCVESSGALLTDFHTTQVPPGGSGKKKRHYVSRRDELSIPHDELKTILSYRDYRTEALAIACIWPLSAARWPLERLADALRHPVFSPYLGRRSCPPALPFAPQIREASSPTEALRAAKFPDREFLEPIRQSDASRIYFWEGEDGGFAPIQSNVRRDAARSRSSWQFGERIEHQAFERKDSNASESD